MDTIFSAVVTSIARPLGLRAALEPPRPLLSLALALLSPAPELPLLLPPAPGGSRRRLSCDCGSCSPAVHDPNGDLGRTCAWWDMGGIL